MAVPVSASAWNFLTATCDPDFPRATSWHVYLDFKGGSAFVWERHRVALKFDAEMFLGRARMESTVSGPLNPKRHLGAAISRGGGPTLKLGAARERISLYRQSAST